MKNAVTIRRASEGDRDAIEGMAPAYFAEILPDGPAPSVAFLNRYWRAPDRQAFLIEAGSDRIGFALIRTLQGSIHQLAEFTIRPGFRGHHYGTTAAHLIFASIGGRWELGVARDPPGTIRFWRACLGTCNHIFDLVQGPPLTPSQIASFSFRIQR